MSPPTSPASNRGCYIALAVIVGLPLLIQVACVGLAVNVSDDESYDCAGTWEYLDSNRGDSNWNTIYSDYRANCE